MRAIYEIQSQIPAGRIVKRLGRFATGEWERVRVATDDGVETYEERPIEMSANQVRAAIALLNKVMPDLQSMALAIDVKPFEEVSLEQLRAQLRGVLQVGEVIDVQARSVEQNLLELPESTSENDLLAL